MVATVASGTPSSWGVGSFSMAGGGVGNSNRACATGGSSSTLARTIGGGKVDAGNVGGNNAVAFAAGPGFHCGWEDGGCGTGRADGVCILGARFGGGGIKSWP